MSNQRISGFPSGGAAPSGSLAEPTGSAAMTKREAKFSEPIASGSAIGGSGSGSAYVSIQADCVQYMY
jgi:hypothetical protein